MTLRAEPDFPSSTVETFVVDDDLDMAMGLATYLTKAGVASQPMGDGWTALRLLAEGSRPGVIVSDLRMPGLDGIEFATRLGALDAADRPEVIFLSGAASFDDAVAAIRVGAIDMLQKPAPPARVERAVKDALIRRRARQREEGLPRAARTSPAGSLGRKKGLLEELRAVRRLRTRHFGSDLFSDPNWEMLLDLYDATLVGKDVTTTSLGAASGLPLSTALRRMDELQGHGLIARKADGQDRRRVLVHLTEAGLDAVDRFFDGYAALPRKGSPHGAASS